MATSAVMNGPSWAAGGAANDLSICPNGQAWRDGGADINRADHAFTQQQENKP